MKCLMNMSYPEIKYCKQTAKFEIIKQHLISASPSFMPPLNTYVDINRYAKKIRNYAITFEAWSNDVLVGLAAVYFNDNITKIGFCTNLSVLEEYQGMGIGYQLMNNVINYGNNHGFSKINLETKIFNRKAIAFYTKIGFEKIGIEKNSLKFSYQLNKNNG